MAGEEKARAEALDGLKRRFGDRFQAGLDHRRQHANSLTWIAPSLPDAVLWPETTAEVQEIVRMAGAARLPVIAFGAGTSLEGQVNAPHRGIVIDMSRMTQIIDIRAADFDCTVEAGVARPMLNAALRDTGLFFAVDPGAGEATLGGMAATRASGTNAVRYGTMRELVRSVKVVLASGEVLDTGTRARKSAAGLDLTRLFVGSEGMLGIVTELTLALHPIPETIVAAVCPFESVRGACEATIAALQSGLDLARIELLDALQIKVQNHYSGTEFPELPTLFVEIHGSPVTARDAVERFEAVARGFGAKSFAWGQSEDERRTLWQARHAAFWAVKAEWPGKATVVSDVCVPISRLADCVVETIDDIERSRLVAPIVGHVGDGNFHAIFVVDLEDQAEMAAARACLERMAERALAMGGTCTGEHGIGEGKHALLHREAGAAGIATMRAIKAALDPIGIMNPGKSFMLDGGS